MNNAERDELLIRIDERTANMVERFNDHLTAHRWINRIGLGAIGSFFVGLVMWLVGK